MTDESPLFLRLRNIAFSCVIFFSLLLVILYSIVIFLQWDLMDRSERSLVAVMLVVNVTTLITLLILLVVEFRVWLDVARMFFLFLAQIGTAGAFVYWRPRFRCEEKLGDQQGVCDMISLYILVTSWVVPVLLLTYLVGLAIRSYRYRAANFHVGSTSDTEQGNAALKEGPHSGRPSLLPIMSAFPTPASLVFPPDIHKARQSVNAKRSTVTASSRYSSLPATPFTSSSPGRLTKRSPLVDFV